MVKDGMESIYTFHLQCVFVFLWIPGSVQSRVHVVARSQTVVLEPDPLYLAEVCGEQMNRSLVNIYVVLPLIANYLHVIGFCRENSM